MTNVKWESLSLKAGMGLSYHGFTALKAVEQANIHADRKARLHLGRICALIVERSRDEK